uniref:Heat shock factor binding protein 1 n=1 Tax=Neogobius melanostomus TaxID=47308 RepID=A0A8C6WNC2_9GOBI
NHSADSKTRKENSLTFDDTISLCTNVHNSLTVTLDEMGSRIDDLEKNVSELMTQAGMDKQSEAK